MSKAEDHQSFRFEGVEIRPGTSFQVEVPISRMLAGNWASMPVVVVHGRTPGPVVWVSGAVHGDELNGIAIVRRLINSLKPMQFAGTLLAVPIVNVFGVTTGSRYLPDRRDLNRSFPGSATGSQAARLADLFFDRIVSRCDLGIDFHTGSNGRANLPQVRCDLDDAETRRHAEAFAPHILVHASLRDGSIRAAARQRGICVLVHEAGEAERLNQKAINMGVEGSLRVLHELGMLKQAPPRASQAALVSRSTRWTRASRSGLCLLQVELGEKVMSGQRVATIADSVGTKEVSIFARTTGIVIGLQRMALVHRGDAIVHIAELES